jgi:formate dehydrogenase assembly factor FdhD
LLVTGRISAELAFKAARAGVLLVGRAVSGRPRIHRGDT